MGAFLDRLANAPALNKDIVQATTTSGREANGCPRSFIVPSKVFGKASIARLPPQMGIVVQRGEMSSETDLHLQHTCDNMTGTAYESTDAMEKMKMSSSVGRSSIVDVGFLS